MARRTIGIHEKLPFLESLPLSFQHLTAMFGATILVPILLGVDPAIALLMNGVGTLIYSWVTKGGIPAYLGSSFAFIAPVMLIISTSGGFAHAQSGFIFFGLFFVLISFVVKKWGIGWIDIVMPPAVMGAVVAIIGLELAPVAAQQAGLAPWPTAVGQIVQPFVVSPDVMLVSMFTLCVGIIGSVLFKGFLQVLPILIATIAGYLMALAMGMVDTTSIGNAAWFALPHFQAPVLDFNAIIIIAPACIVVLAEHISHLIVTGKITDSDLMKDPGLHRSLLGDGISNILSGFAGSPPNTTYGENIGVMAITRVYSVWVIRGAAIFCHCIFVHRKSFSGHFHYSFSRNGRNHHVTIWCNRRTGLSHVCRAKSGFQQKQQHGVGCNNLCSWSKRCSNQYWNRSIKRNGFRSYCGSFAFLDFLAVNKSGINEQGSLNLAENIY
jgi:uracil permease